jgi:hypothetical protein
VCGAQPQHVIQEVSHVTRVLRCIYGLQMHRILHVSQTKDKNFFAH